MGCHAHCDICYTTLRERLLTCAAVEDPFDATDNCARTIGFSKIDGIVTAFGRAAAVMNAVRDEAGGLAFPVANTEHMANPLTSLARNCPDARRGPLLGGTS